jgi:transposase InsO family protein
MRRDGMSASRAVVQRIFDREGLKSVHCRRRQRSLTDSRKSRGKDLKNLTRDLDINRPFQVLSSDISYIRTKEGFDYLCQVRDVYTNTVLAESQSKTMKKELVLDTIEQVMARWNLPSNVIFHNDRGSQV